MGRACETYWVAGGEAGEVGRSEGKRLLVGPRNRRENNIKIYVKGIGWGKGLD